MNKIITILLIFVSCVAFGQGAKSSLRADIISFWKFQRTAGSVIDEVQNNAGTNVGATRGATGKIDNAFDFERNDGDYVDYGDVLDFGFTDKFTFSGWFKLESTISSDVYVILSKRKRLTPFNGYYLGYDHNNQIFFILAIDNAGGGTGTIGARFTSTTLNTGQWYHFVAINDGTNISGGWSLYLDGVDSDTDTFTGTPTNLTGSGLSFNIGTMDDNASSDQEFDGIIDEVKVFGRDVTLLEIKLLHNSGDGLLYVYENFINGKITYTEWTNYEMDYLYTNLKYAA